MEIINQIIESRNFLKQNLDNTVNPIDETLPIIPPFRGKDEIKLIILGQDPTIRNIKSRQNITCTLNLDKNGSLRNYILSICAVLDLSIENVYATNLFKYFYTYPPANTIDVLNEHLSYNLELLKLELTEFDTIPIITLGEPVFKLLTQKNAKVREFWDFDNKSHMSNGHFISSTTNKLDRIIFPFPHQPSLRKTFYKATFNDYGYFMNNNIKKSHNIT